MDFTIRTCILLLITFFTIQTAAGQLLGDSKFRIYEGGTAGANVTLRIENDGNYSMAISKLNCSLCDLKALTDSINRTGTWKHSNDTLTISENDKSWQFLVLNKRELKPLFLLDEGMYEPKNDSLQTRLKKILLISALGDFHLIYNTYENGNVKTTFNWSYISDDSYPLHGPVIYYRKSGTLQKIEHYKKGKLRKTDYFN